MPFVLRPGITNPNLWHPARPRRAEWEAVRKLVLERDDSTCAGCGHRATKLMNVHHLDDTADDSLINLALLCVACHSLMHVGRSLTVGAVEVWRSEISQVEIVRRTRDGIRQGKTLSDIKSLLPLRRGPYPPNSTQYANDLIKTIGTSARASLEEPLCATFVKIERWQI